MSKYFDVCKKNKNFKSLANFPCVLFISIIRNFLLLDIGFPNVYEEIIYPGMKQGIVTAVLLHNRNLDRRKNSFEVFGADFMLTEDFKPWLLEINSNPALHASTPITAKMCPQMLEDVIKGKNNVIQNS